MRVADWLLIPLLRLVVITRRTGQKPSPSESARTPGPVSPRPLPERRPEPDLRLKVEVHETGNGPVVRLRGEAGVPEVSALQASLLPLVARRPGWVTFDLSELVFISSLAMGVLVDYRRGAVRAGARVCLAPDLHPTVREALDRAELRGLFETDGGVAARVGPGPVAGGRQIG